MALCYHIEQTLCIRLVFAYVKTGSWLMPRPLRLLLVLAVRFFRCRRAARMFAVAHRGVTVTHTRVHRHGRRKVERCAFDVVVVEDFLCNTLLRNLRTDRYRF